MADILNPDGSGADPNNPGSNPFTALSLDPSTMPDSGIDFGSLLSSLGNGLSGLNMNTLAGILGGALPALGTLASGGTVGTINGTTNQTGTNNFTGSGTSVQDQTFQNLMNQILSGTNFQNQNQTQTGTTQTNQAMNGGFNQAQQGGFNQAQQGGFNQAQNGGFGQQQQGGFTQGQTGGFGQQQQGGFQQGQQGGMSQQQQGGFGQQQQGGMSQQQVQQLNQTNAPYMMPEAQAAGAAASGALGALLPQAQSLWGQGAGFLGQLTPLALQALQGHGNIPMPTPDLIKQAFEPFISSIGDQAITAARNAGFAGGADLLGGAATPLAGRALANVPGQEAAALLQAQQSIPLLNAQIQQMMMQGIQGASGIGNSMMNPLAQAIGQQVGLVSAYPTGQTITGTNTNNTTGTNFGNTTGTNFGNTTGTNFSDSSGTNFGNVAGTNFTNASGTNFGNTSGTNFNQASGTNFGNTSGSNFGNTSGSNFQDVNSTSLQNLINSINTQGGFTQAGQTNQSGMQHATGATTQQGASNTTQQGNTTQSQNIPIPSLIGSAIGGGLTGLAGAQASQDAAAQNQAFLNLLGNLSVGLSGMRPNA